MRENVREAVMQMVVHAFSEFYEQRQTMLRNFDAIIGEVMWFSLENVRNRVYGVFGGSIESSSSNYSNRSDVPNK